MAHFNLLTIKKPKSPRVLKELIMIETQKGLFYIPSLYFLEFKGEL